MMECVCGGGGHGGVVQDRGLGGRCRIGFGEGAGQATGVYGMGGCRTGTESMGGGVVACSM